MQTSQLRKRLIQQMDDEPRVRNWVVMSKCAAGLAVVALIAFIGVSGTERHEDIASAQQTAHGIQSAEQHRRQVFEERRIRFAQGLDAHRIAKQQAPSEAMARVIVR